MDTKQKDAAIRAYLIREMPEKPSFDEIVAWFNKAKRKSSDELGAIMIRHGLVYDKRTGEYVKELKQ